MKSKGFTLIELLAVTVIIAVVSLITVPLVMDMIEKTKKGAFESSAYGIIKSAEQVYMDMIITNS